MSLGTAKSPAGYEDLLRVPDHLVAEILQGDLHTTPRPALHHARVASILGASLVGRFDRGAGDSGGWWFLHEPELHLAEDVLVPDLAGWRQERLPTIPAAAFLTVAPDWVSEIVSPSTEKLDRVEKLAVYARESVSHVWLINPTTRTLEALELERSRWILLGTYGDHAKVRARPFDELELDLASLWSGTVESSS